MVGCLGILIELEVIVFINIVFGSVEVVWLWVDVLCNVGFVVFVKLKVDEDSDVDCDMLVYIDECYCEGFVVLVVVLVDG